MLYLITCPHFRKGRMFHDQPWVRYTNQHGPTLPKEGLSRPFNGLGDNRMAVLDQNRIRVKQLKRIGGYETESFHIQGPAYLHYKVVDPKPSQ